MLADVYLTAEICCLVLPVSVKKALLHRRRTLGQIGFQSTKSGPGEQFLLEDCKAKAPAKGVLVSQTPLGC